jgi:hypothetical protein
VTPVTEIQSAHAIAEDLARLDAISLSEVSAHCGQCCFWARRTVLGRFDRWPDLGSRLAAIPVLIPWGPVRWPVHWCSLAADEEPTGDCGVHAAVAAALLADAGWTFARGRAALEPSPYALRHWRATWSEAGADDRWVASRVVHHEVIRIDERWWDPTEARWFAGPGDHVLSGRVAALRTEDAVWRFPAVDGGRPR